MMKTLVSTIYPEEQQPCINPGVSLGENSNVNSKYFLSTLNFTAKNFSNWNILVKKDNIKQTRFP